MMKKNLRVGDVVKSMDFPDVENCYMVGKVVAVSESFGEFRAEFIKRVWLGSEDRKFKTDYFTAPLQGKAFLDRADAPRVVVIG